MNNAITRIKQLRPATLIAMLALFVAIGGTATAASGLIKGKKLKNNTVAGKKLKNRTITKKKLAPATVKALKGNQGLPGKDGIVSPTFKEFSSINIPANLELGIGSVNVPAGRYMITATVQVTSNATNNVSCGVATNNGGGSQSSVFDPDGGGRTALPIQLVTDTDTVTQVSIGCHSGNQVTGASGNVIVTPVQ